jgi:pyridoxine 4-dehydrogenase
MSTTSPASASGTFAIGGELTVNRLGFGAMRITGKGIWGPPADHDEAIRTLKRAVELGINLIDTADSYGPDVSEELIAEALHPYPEDLIIATKAGLTRSGPDEWSPDGRPEHIREAVEGSLRKLRVDTIDLYQLHRIDPKVPVEESLGTFEELRAEGKIRFVGLSEVSVEELEHAKTLAPIATVQNKYNLGDRSSEDVLDACERDGLGFIPWFPLNFGGLAKPGGPLDDAAKRHDAPPSQLALAWLLARSPVMLPIPGTGSVSHLEENVGAAALELSAEELEALTEAA